MASAAAPVCEPQHQQMAELHQFIDGEIASRLARNVSWSKLETCFKWMRIHDYLKEAGVHEDHPSYKVIKDLLRNNDLAGVEYDAVHGKVLKLGRENL